MRLIMPKFPENGTVCIVQSFTEYSIEISTFLYNLLGWLSLECDTYQIYPDSPIKAIEVNSVMGSRPKGYRLKIQFLVQNIRPRICFSSAKNEQDFLKSISFCIGINFPPFFANTQKYPDMNWILFQSLKF